MTAALLGGSILTSFLLSANLWPDRFLRLLYRVKVLGDISIRFNLPENLRLGATLLAPLNLVVLLWFSGMILLRRQLLKPYVPTLIFILPFFGWQIISLGIFPSQLGIVRFLSQLWIPLVFMVTLVSRIKMTDLTKILNTTQILTAFMLTTVVTEWSLGWPSPIQQMDADIAWEAGRTVRFGGIWGIRSKAAECWAEMSVLVSLCALLVGRRQRLSYLHIINVGYCLFVISLTGSKTPFFVLSSASLVTITLSARAVRAVPLITLATIGSIILFSKGAFDRTLERFQVEQTRLENDTTFDAVGTGRVGVWSAGLHNWRQAGATTILIGGGITTSVDFVNAGDRLGNEKRHGIHSQHLAVLVELGVIGMIFYLLFWFGLFRLMTLPQSADRDCTHLRLVAVSLLVALLLRGLAGDVLNGVYYTWYFAIPTALLAKQRFDLKSANDAL